MNIESPWKTYPKAVLFILPALGAWCFACVFLLPKLKELWVQTGFADTTAGAILNFFVWPLEHRFLIPLVIIVVLALLEWRSRRWPRFRRLAVGTAAFVVNVGVIFFLTAMLTYGLIAMAAK